MCVFVVGTAQQSGEECLKFLFVLISLIYFLQLPNCCAKELYIYIIIYILAVYKMQFVIVCSCSV